MVDRMVEVVARRAFQPRLRWLALCLSPIILEITLPAKPLHASEPRLLTIPFRHRGKYPASATHIPIPTRIAAWDDWGRRHLQDGDILFRLGNAHAACGLFQFSKAVAIVSDSPYSHNGIVAREGGEVVVYDTCNGGPKRTPFRLWILDCAGPFGVKRPRAEFQGYMPHAVAFARSAYCRRVPFDRALRPGGDRFYCSELVELAYRSGGLALSDPIPINRLPMYHEHTTVARAVEILSPIDMRTPAFVPGNDAIGLWSSRALETVYATPDAVWPRP